MNSFYQLCYLIPGFRNLFFKNNQVLDAPWKNRLIRGFKQLFCRLKSLDSQNQTTEFMNEVFGWNQSEMLNQHDIQEAIRIIFGYLEDAFKGTPSQEVFDSILKGTQANFFKCKVCLNESVRQEDFFDIFLNVKNKHGGFNPDLVSALNDSFEVESMDGTNQYFCESCAKKQDATRGMRLTSIPEYVTFYINRFEFDPVTYERKKVKSEFDFPFAVDLGPFTLNKKNSVYEFFAGIIHRGTAYSGHYHVVIRDLEMESKNEDSKHCYNDFNDTIVNPVDEDYLNKFKTKGDENCYLLIYKRKGEFINNNVEADEDDLTLAIKTENARIAQSRVQYERLKQCLRVNVVQLSHLLEQGLVSVDDLQSIEGEIEESDMRSLLMDKTDLPQFSKLIEETFAVNFSSQKLFLVRIKNNSRIYFVEEIDLEKYVFGSENGVSMNSILFLVDECFIEFPFFKDFVSHDVR